jgi:hypothetical protein
MLFPPKTAVLQFIGLCLALVEYIDRGFALAQRRMV